MSKYFRDHLNNVNSLIPGYYCTLGAYEHSPTDNVTGAICPMGYYCPTMSVAPTACDSGYYLDAYGSSVISNCKICTAGKCLW